jgi:hypothetical protein
LLIIEPKAEFRFIRAFGNTAKTSAGYDLQYNATSYASGRAALLIRGYNPREEFAGLVNIAPYLEAAFNNEFKGKETIIYAGAPYKNEFPDKALKLRAVLTRSLAKMRISSLAPTTRKALKLNRLAVMPA